jgi:UDP-N-acetylglucosamine 2-epimerase
LRNNSIYLIRPHPSQENGFFIDWLKGKKDAFLAANYPLHTLIRNTSLLVVRTSTVGLEAIYMHKKVLQLDADFHTDFPLAKMGLAWGVNSLEEISEAIQHILEDQSEFERIQQAISKSLPREPAAAKIANTIVNKLA